MRAAVVPAVKGRWEVREVPTPEPGPNQVLIKIRASGLCYTDVHITEGFLPARFPRTLGHEYAARGKVKVIAETYRLDEIARAYDRVAAGRVRFRAVILN